MAKDNGGQPLKWNSPEELEQLIKGYYEWSEQKNKPLTMSGLAWWLGCSRTTLLNYENSEENGWLKRIDDSVKKQYVNSIKEAKRRIEFEYESALFDRGKTPGAIFTLKNNYNWVDKQEVVSTVQEKAPDLSGLSEDDLKKLLDK